MSTVRNLNFTWRSRLAVTLVAAGCVAYLALACCPGKRGRESRPEAGAGERWEDTDRIGKFGAKDEPELDNHG